MHLCKNATVTVHMCTVTVALVFNVLHFFPLSFTSLSQLLTFTFLSRFISPSIHQSVQPYSHQSPISLASRSPISPALLIWSEAHRYDLTHLWSFLIFLFDPFWIFYLISGLIWRAGYGSGWWWLGFNEWVLMGIDRVDGGWDFDGWVDDGG